MLPLTNLTSSPVSRRHRSHCSPRDTDARVYFWDEGLRLRLTKITAICNLSHLLSEYNIPMHLRLYIIFRPCTLKLGR